MPILSMLKTCLRQLVRDPLWSLAIIVSLALGVGLGTAVVSFLQAFLWTPLTSFEEPDRVVAVFQEPLPGQAPQGAVNPQLSVPAFERLAVSDAFAAATARQFLQVRLGDGTGDERKANGEIVTAGYFRTAGVETLALGRPFLASEDEVPGRDAVVVLSHDTWRDDFGADPDLVGRTVRLNGHPFTVVGVAPAGFAGASRLSPSELWVPLAAHPWVFPYSAMIGPPDGRVLRPLARLAPGVDLETARRRMTALGRELAEDFPEAQGAQTLALRPLAGGEPSAFEQGVARRGAVALGMATLLLLIACANAVNLLLARSRARRRQTALHAALGATSGRLALYHLIESLLLALSGASLGVLLAWGIRKLLWSARPPYLPESILDTGLDPGLLAAAVGLALLTAPLTALPPMWAGRRPSLTSVLQEEAPAAAGRRTGVSGWTLVGFEVALCTLALGIAALFLADLDRVRDVDPGFRTDLAVASFDFYGEDLEPAAVDDLRRRLGEAAAAVPGVRSVTVGENWPLGGFRMFRAVRPAETAEDAAVNAGSSLVAPGYFDTVGVSLLRGRGFEAAEEAGPPRTVVLGETLARTLFPDGDPLGRLVAVEGLPDGARVVGVAADTAVMSLEEDPQPFLYLPLTPGSAPRFSIHARTAGAPGDVLPALRRALAGTASRLPLEDLTTVPDILDRSLWMERLSARLLAVVGLCALGLAALGIYAVASLQASRSRREVGVRVALGEPRGRIVRRFTLRGLPAVAAGLAAGLLGAYWVHRFLAGLMYDAGALRPLHLATVAVALLFVALLANLLPALRAVRSDPAEVLRAS